MRIIVYFIFSISCCTLVAKMILINLYPSFSGYCLYEAGKKELQYFTPNGRVPLKKLRLLKSKPLAFTLTSYSFTIHSNFKKGKGLPQQAEVAQDVPGRLRPWIFLTFGTTRMVGR